MSTLVKSLNEEHRRMVKLLSLLDHEVERFRTGSVLDYLLISSILDYLTRVSQHKHHLVEDEIFKCLKKHDPSGASTIGDLPLDHEKLDFLCNTLRDAVRNVELDNELPRMWLVSVANEYRGAMRRHLVMEEREFFPLALKRLEAEDWHDIERRIDREADPEFDRLETADLFDLRQDILTWRKEQPVI